MQGPEIDPAEAEPLQANPAVEEPKPTFFQRINNLRKAITVEPAAFLMLFASVLAAITTQTFALEKTCRVNLNLSDAICNSVRNQDSDNNTANERLIQEYVANLLTWKSVITSALPCIILPFVGGWMDQTGRRKLLMVLPLIGEVFQNMGNILNVIFFYQLPVEYLIYFDAFFSSIAGGWSVMFLAIFSYIADITTEANRTHRLGLVSLCTYVGMPIGLALSGIILKQFGYYAIYGTSMTLHVLNLFYITFFLSDPMRTKEMKEKIYQDSRCLPRTVQRCDKECCELINPKSAIIKCGIDNRETKTVDNMENEKNDKDHLPEDPKETDPLKSDIPVKVKRSLASRFVNVIKNTTIEPSMLLFVMSNMISIISTQNLSLDKACRVNLNFTHDICQSLRMQDMDSQNDYERDTQKLLARAMAYKTYITSTVPCIMALFVGSWSDITGHRKMFLIISISGQLLLCMNNMLNVYFFMQLPLEFLVFTEAVLEGFSGGWCVFFLTSFSYISAITTEETRTFRMGLINFSLTVGFPIGMGISGVLLKNYGYYGSYGVAFTCQFFNLCYNVFVLKDPVRTQEQKEHDGRGIWYALKTFFDPAHIRDTFIVVFKKTPDNRCRRLCMLLATVCILFGPMYGEIAIMYMSTRYRFNWDEVKFSLFQTYNFVIHTFGTIFSILVFSKHLQWHDSMLGIISTVSKIASSFVYCFAPNGRIFFIAPLVDVLNGTSLLALRSIFSKSVEPSELGKVNSIVGLTENLMPLVYVPLYTKVYTATMEVLPGTPFLMGASMTIPGVFVFIWLFYEHRKGLRKQALSDKPVNGVTDVELHTHSS